MSEPRPTTVHVAALIAANSDSMPDDSPLRGPIDWSDLQRRLALCREELRVVQARLGTARERASDLEDAVLLGHRLANLLVPLRLWQHLREDDRASARPPTS